MSSETITPDQPLHESPHKDSTAKVESTEPNSHNVVSVEVVNSESEMKIAEDNGGESEHVEEKKEEETDHEVEEKNDEETDHEGEDEEGSDEEDESESKKLEKDNSPSTPVSGSGKRPVRERKSVDRYTVSSPSKFPRSSATKPLSVEQGNGTQLKDIPNVAFKLSKRKPDDSLRTLHNILFGKKAKAHDLKKNIGLFSGYVWAENEQKQRAKIKEKIEKCVKDKLVEFCDILNVPINKTGLKKEEISAKLLEFLESPHATTDVLLAEKVNKGKKRTKKATPSKSSREASAKKQKQTSSTGKKRKQSSDVEEDNDAESSDAKDDSQEDGEDVSAFRSESDNEESKSEEEEDQQKPHKHSSKRTVKEVQTTPVTKATAVKAAKSNQKTTKQSSSEKNATDSSSASLSKSKQSASKKQRTVKETQDNEGKVANKKQTDESSKDLVKDEGKGKGSKKAKAEPSRDDLYAAAVDTLKKVDFNTATLSDILKLLGTHFDLDLMHRKAEVKDVITDVINNMSDEEDGEEAENVDA
ncbi:PREDICTED: glutamic acid-rich protein-like isoform X2 [Lupinus angustifolius]|uniref:glutamic acid-rich protein-like isoform X2 n=1 Tax=Lupinus angustifolius TaxID=3871 RepID=UPI00092F9EC7|nr:PREDICTED: glutamic acid-rich protein-like isoform X2 [Lupinus angustifolius]